MKTPLFGAAMIAAALLGTAGCACKSAPAEVHSIYTSGQCAGEGRDIALILIADAQEWEHYFASILAAGTMPAPEAPVVDFTRSAVLVIDMGQKPTGGYGVQVSTSDAAIEEGVLQVHVVLQSPAPGTMQTQALTHPCLALNVPAQGYERIEVYDERERLVASVKREE